jgi:dGTPase
MYKTQVLAAQTNDHHRTRLTHTLEVAQISRTIARQLGLNEDLTEAIALGHDLGHPPFGHAGESALAECMKEHGGFEHNRHGLRIVEWLEYRYADFPGLNLSWEVLQAMAQHSKLRATAELSDLAGSGQPILEAQIVDSADSLAYDTHDVDDALGVGLLTPEDMNQVEFWQRAVDQVRQKHPHIGPLQFVPTVIRALISWQVTDLLEHTQERIRHQRVRTLEDVRQVGGPLAGPGPQVLKWKAELESFLHERVYCHHRVLRMAAKGKRIIHQLFDEFRKNPDELPERYRQRAQAGSLEQTICDYLAGMTDRFVQDEYLRLFQPFSSV